MSNVVINNYKKFENIIICEDINIDYIIAIYQNAKPKESVLDIMKSCKLTLRITVVLENLKALI